MRRGIWILTMLVASACASSSPRAPRPPPPSPEARATKAIEWSKREASHKPWLGAGKRVQLVVTGGRSKGEQFVWVIANGTVVRAAYRCSEGEVEQLTRAFLGDMTFPEQGTPADSMSYGILGTVIKPNPQPPDPDPPGFPLKYIGQVMNLAWRMDRDVQQVHAGDVLAP